MSTFGVVLKQFIEVEAADAVEAALLAAKHHPDFDAAEVVEDITSDAGQDKT